MTDLPRARVAWVSPQLSYMVASTRYRCYYPALALGELDIESVFYRSSKEVIPHLKGLDAIVFVKLLDSDSVKLAGLAKDQGVKVLIDLCDNIIVANYPKTPDLHPALRFAGIGAFADAIVVPSPALSEALRPMLRPGARFVVIPDQVETRTSFAAAKRLQEEAVKPAEKRPAAIAQRGSRFAAHAARHPADAMMILRRKISTAFRLFGTRLSRLDRRTPPPPSKGPQAATVDELKSACANSATQGHLKSVVWFGNYGAAHSDFGMLALLLAAPALEAVNKDIPLELTVISNKKDLFDSAIAQIDVPTRYINWSTEAVFDSLKEADICLLPFGMDAFSVTKSANRAVLALEYGVPVVTTRLASMEPLAGAVGFDDWEAGLRRFLGKDGAKERAAAIAAARPILAATYSPRAIGKAWATLIDDATTKIRPGYVKTPYAGEVAVLLDAPESSEQLLSVIDELRHREDVLLRVLVTPHALAGSTRPLIERQIIPYALEAEPIMAEDDRILRTVDFLLTAGDSLKDPGSLTASVVRIAVARGVRTFGLVAPGDGTAISAHSLLRNDGSPMVLGAASARDFVKQLLDGTAQARTNKRQLAEPMSG